MAATVEYKSWTESDDPAPGTIKDALVMFKAASINFGQPSGTTLVPLVALADVDGLAYSVETSTSYAPSYQIDIVSKSKNVTYARLVWEPYMQSSPEGPNTGTFTGLETGLWWGNRVFTGGKGASPFGSAEGSQSKAQKLSWFMNYFGDDAQVAFFGLKQGTTTDSTSKVTSLTFEGQKIALNATVVDATPFTSKDIDAAVAKATAPLTSQLAALQNDFDAYKVSHPLTTDGAQTGYVNTDVAAKAKWNLVDKASLVASQNAEANAKAKIVSISGTEKAGKTVTAKSESISGAGHSYKWYVGGKLIKSATKSTLKLTRSNAHHALSVWVTTTWTDANGAKHSTSAKSKYLRTAYIAR